MSVTANTAMTGAAGSTTISLRVHASNIVSASSITCAVVKARASNGIHLIEKDEAGLLAARHLEQLTHHAGSLQDRQQATHKHTQMQGSADRCKEE